MNTLLHSKCQAIAIHYLLFKELRCWANSGLENHFHLVIFLPYRNMLDGGVRTSEFFVDQKTNMLKREK